MEKVNQWAEKQVKKENIFILSFKLKIIGKL